MGKHISLRTSHGSHRESLEMATFKTEAEKTQAYNAEFSEKHVDEPHILEGFTVDPKVERRLLRKV
jgi:hypothetical protein